MKEKFDSNGVTIMNSKDIHYEMIGIFEADNIPKLVPLLQKILPIIITIGFGVPMIGIFCIILINGLHK